MTLSTYRRYTNNYLSIYIKNLGETFFCVVTLRQTSRRTDGQTDNFLVAGPHCMQCMLRGMNIMQNSRNHQHETYVRKKCNTSTTPPCRCTEPALGIMRAMRPHRAAKLRGPPNSTAPVTGDQAPVTQTSVKGASASVRGQCTYHGWAQTCAVIVRYSSSI